MKEKVNRLILEHSKDKFSNKLIKKLSIGIKKGITRLSTLIGNITKETIGTNIKLKIGVKKLI